MHCYSSHQVQPCTKKMKKSEENFYWEKKEKVSCKENFFLPKKTFSSSFVIVLTRCKCHPEHCFIACYVILGGSRGMPLQEKI